MSAEVLLINRVSRGVAKYSVVSVGERESQALMVGIGNLTPLPGILASKVTDLPVRISAPDGCYRISMRVVILEDQEDLNVNDYVGETCVELVT